MLRSILAIAAGYAIMVVIVVVGTAAAAALLSETSTTADGTMPLGSRGYMAANLTSSVLAALAGGFTTARMIGPRSLPHVLALAGIVAAFGIGSALAGTGQPGWYAWVIPVVGVVGVLAGGHIGARRGAAAIPPRAA
jgi:hypothetical protein